METESIFVYHWIFPIPVLSQDKLWHDLLCRLEIDYWVLSISKGEGMGEENKWCSSLGEMTQGPNQGKA